MKNESGTANVRKSLYRMAEDTLRKQGWSVSRIAGAGKASLRSISKNGVTKRVSIKTSQDQWIAFGWNAANSTWHTLDVVDLVVIATVDDTENPRFANIHIIDGDEMRDRFNRAHAARTAAHRVINDGVPMWISVYGDDVAEPVAFVAAGAGIVNPAIASYPLPEASDGFAGPGEPSGDGPDGIAPPTGQWPTLTSAKGPSGGAEPPLTIPEAKRRLAASLGVDIDDIKIIISS